MVQGWSETQSKEGFTTRSSRWCNLKKSACNLKKSACLTTTTPKIPRFRLSAGCCQRKEDLTTRSSRWLPASRVRGR